MDEQDFLHRMGLVAVGDILAVAVTVLPKLFDEMSKFVYIGWGWWVIYWLWQELR